MPDPTNIARAVLNSSNGRWYKYEREGDRLKALDPDGLILKPAGSGANAIDVYRVTDERGDFKAMVATAEKPATLKVWAKDPESDNLSLVEAVSCTSFADNRCRFVLAADYSAFGNRAARLDFVDGTAGTITATYDECTLYEFQDDEFTPRPGSYRLLAAVVENLDDKRVVFESSDPAVCRIERGTNISDKMRVSEVPQQTDQYCFIIGVGKGTCTVTCKSLADPALEDVVDVTVVTHPDDVPKVIGGDYAQQLTDLLHNVRCPISIPPRNPHSGVPYPNSDLSAEYSVSGTTDGAIMLWMRSFVVPGGEEDTFDVDLNFAGTVLAQNPGAFQNYQVGGRFALCIGLAGSGQLGLPCAHGEMYYNQTYHDEFYQLWGAIEVMGCASARVINDWEKRGTQGNDGLVTIDEDISFQVQGGETIVVAWLLANHRYEDLAYCKISSLPNGNWHALMTVNAITHHPHGGSQ